MSEQPQTTTLSQANSVAFFREASPYVRQHQKRLFVIAFPGEVIELEHFRRIIQDIAIISALGARVVLVHGMRPQINTRLAAKDHPAHFHNGLRITDYPALVAAQETCGYLRIQIENLLSFALAQPGFSQNGQIVTSGNFITARPVGVMDGIDYGYTGQIRRIHHEHILTQLEHDRIVLLSPLGYSPTGETYNLRYEQLAIEAAQALSADKVLILDDASIDLPTSLTLEEARQCRDQHPLLPQIIDALEHKVGRVHLLDANADGALLMELYTRRGVGSMIAANASESVRPATADDISGIMEVIRPLEQAGALVRRSREQLELEITRFQVIVLDRQIIGCAALYTTDDPQTGELACLAVAPNYRSSDRGEQLLRAITKAAAQQNMKQLMVMTTQTTDWFREHGFREATIADLPDNKKRLYNFKRNSKVFFLAI
uniref:Amino-acid acetyltransferase n=1 Tax=uncultured Thiotrichaceae bacterium TaxID=298394 RepID=A0A6S6TN09_9GAMM|nr:MAG: N-acetylglutamate synthase (EC [uncultured Thiotrichaceae bacterium]